MIKKSEVIYIRATIPEKEEIERLARSNGKSVSAFMLSTVERAFLDGYYKMIQCPTCGKYSSRRIVRCSNCKKSY